MLSGGSRAFKQGKLLVGEGSSCSSFVIATSGKPILGSWFQQAFYISFDYELSRIGFAEPALLEGFVAPELPNAREESDEMSIAIILVIVLAALLGISIIYYIISYFLSRKPKATPQMQSVVVT